jgi:3-oxoacyl-[acyl-carrier-protein] synthase II
MGKIVITGLGVVSALGTSKQSFWKALLNQAAPFRRLTRLDTAPWGAEVADFEGPVPVKAKQPWTGNRSIQFAIAATQQALADAGLGTDNATGSQVGVVFGSTRSCLDLVVKLDQDGVQRGPRTVDPLLFPDANPCAPSCRVSLQLGLNAFNAILSNGPTAGLDAIHYACGAIRDGLAPVVLACGVEELTPVTYLFRESMEHVADSGKGVVLGEGCAVLVLESEEHARNRQANILAEVSGYGTCFWPHYPLTDDAFAAPEYAMRSAMATAGVKPEQIDVVFASANGDPAGDRLEARALQSVVPGAPVTAIKANLGETHSAAGCLQTAACVLAMRERPALRVGLINCFSTSSSTQTYSSLVIGGRNGNEYS